MVVNVSLDTCCPVYKLVIRVIKRGSRVGIEVYYPLRGVHVVCTWCVCYAELTYVWMRLWCWLGVCVLGVLLCVYVR